MLYSNSPGQMQIGNQPQEPLQPIMGPNNRPIDTSNFQPTRSQMPGIVGQLAIPNQTGAPTGPGQTNPWGGIQRPDLFETFDPNTGKMKSQFQVDLSKIQGQTPWGLMLQDKLDKQYKLGLTDIQGNAQAGAQAGYSRLARQGGITGGGRMALARAANRDAVKGMQNLASNYQDAQTTLGQQDWARQVDIQERNIDRSLGQIARKDQSNLSAWEKEMQTAAAKYMADRMGNGQNIGNAPGDNALMGSTFHNIGVKGDPIFKGKFDPLVEDNFWQQTLGY